MQEENTILRHVPEQWTRVSDRGIVQIEHRDLEGERLEGVKKRVGVGDHPWGWFGRFGLPKTVNPWHPMIMMASLVGQRMTMASLLGDRLTFCELGSYVCR